MKPHSILLTGILISSLLGCRDSSSPESMAAPKAPRPPEHPAISTTPTNAATGQPPKLGEGLSPQGVSEVHRDDCIANLQQIGLAARLWSADHKDHLPSDFPTLSELMPVVRLICPDDQERLKKPIASWAMFGVTNVSYRMLSPGVSETEVETVYVQCSYHGYVLYANGRAVALRK